MPRIISRIIDQYDFEGPPVSGQSLVYDSSTSKFKTQAMSSFGTVNYVGGSGNFNGISLSGAITSSGNLTLAGTLSNVSLSSQVSGVLPIEKGGTNLSGLGTSLQALRVNSGATALEYYSPTTGTVTYVGGTGEFNGITLNGSVSSSGNLSLSGTLSNVSLTSQVSGVLPIANGGTNSTTIGTSGNFLYHNGSGIAGQNYLYLSSGTIVTQNLSGQIANMQEWKDYNNNKLAYIDVTGGYFVNNIKSLPTSSGAGNNINIIASSGVSSGAGGSLILQAGIQAITGGDGTVAIRQASGQTSNLQEWQTPSGTLKASIKNGGGFLFATTSSMIYNVAQLNSYGTYGGIIFEDIAGDGRTRMRQSSSANSSIDFWHSNSAIQLIGCAGNSMFLGGTTWLGTTGGFGGSQATKVSSDQATPQGRIYFCGSTYSSSTNHPIFTSSYNGYEFYTAVNASWSAGQTGQVYGSKTLSASGHTWKFTAASGSVNPLSVQSVSGQTANLQEWQNSSGTALSYMDPSGNFFAVSKSFLIPHPSPDKASEGKKLRYASLEGPENGVYYRGVLTDSNNIILPNYWKDLIDPNNITVNLTACKYPQPNLFVEDINVERILVNSDRPINCNFTVFAERKDIAKLEVEVCQ